MRFETHPYAQYIAERASAQHFAHWDWAAHRESPFHERMQVEGIEVEGLAKGNRRESIVRVPAAQVRLKGFEELATGEHPHGTNTKPFHTLFRNEFEPSESRPEEPKAPRRGEHVHLFSTGTIEQPIVHVIQSHTVHHGLRNLPKGEIEIHREGDNVRILMRNTPHGRHLLAWALSRVMHMPH